jgi:hypothetical protein
VSADAACVANVQEGEAIPVNLHFLVDRSGSMTCPLGAAGQTCGLGNNGAPNNRMPPDRWSAILDALNAFVSAPASSGIGIGLQFFPLTGANGGNGNNNAACNVMSYQIPAVAFDILPAAAARFSMALAGTMPGGNTPTTPALTGALQFASGQRVANPGREVSVVLVSDGIPNGCNASVANAAMAAATAVAATPSIKTYVIGVGPALQSLDQIAVGGGTQRAYLVDTGADVATQFRQALDAIAAPIRCDYAIPTTPGKVLDYGSVNIETRVGANGTPQITQKVPDAASCGAGGWFYDSPTAPTKITLCPSTCAPLTNTMGSHLQILIGCASQTGPIR